MIAAVVWLTGLPSSGKSTLARALATEIERARGARPVVLDGDEVRAALVPKPGYDPAGRDAFYETLARLAAVIESQGHLVMVAATAHRAAFRDRARSLSRTFVEVFVDTPRDECVRRDAKGLYAQASGRQGSQLPGVPGTEYEVPLAPDVTVRPADEPGAIAAAILRLAR